MLDTVIGVSYFFMHLTFTIILLGRYWYYFHFTFEETERAQDNAAGDK